MGQKSISKKELKCIDSHLCYSIKAIIRDSSTKCSGDFLCLEVYDDKSRDIYESLIKLCIKVDNLIRDRTKDMLCQK